jgi:predicted acyl esterase
MHRTGSLFALLLAASVSLAQQRGAPPLSNEQRELKEFVVANYTKHEYRIPMRDGVKLFTSVYVPKDDSGALRVPILLLRTPYSVGPYGIDRYRNNLGPSAAFDKAKYIFAFQDVRGCWMSEGTFENMRPILTY